MDHPHGLEEWGIWGDIITGGVGAIGLAAGLLWVWNILSTTKPEFQKLEERQTPGPLISFLIAMSSLILGAFLFKQLIEYGVGLVL